MSTLVSRLYNWVTDKANSVKITASRMDAEFNQVVTALNRKVLCSASAPANPINGQTWVDTTNKLMKCYLNSEWVIVNNVFVQVAEPGTPAEGYIWYDTANNQIKVYDGTGWETLSLPTGAAPQDILIVGTSTTKAVLAVGTVGQVLMVSTSTTLAWGRPVFATRGEIAHGGTLSAPGGFTLDQCQLHVSVKGIGAYTGGDGDNLQAVFCSVTTAGVVTCYGHQRDNGTVAGTANYLIIAIS